tara:strand:- start:294 stop:1001 length:708 start_codon:yes stop_codon:yes gene_type:complete
MGMVKPPTMGNSNGTRNNSNKAMGMVKPPNMGNTKEPTMGNSTNQLGGGIFNNLFNFGRKKPEPENLNENENITDKPSKNIDDLMSLLNLNKTPKEYLNNSLDFKIEEIPTNLAKHPKCKVIGPEYEIEYSRTGNFKDYFDNYEELNKHYTSSAKKLMEILVNKIISKESGEWEVRKINSEELLKIENDVRKLTIDFYMRCEEIYKKSFISLVRGIMALNQEEIKKSTNEQLEQL